MDILIFKTDLHSPEIVNLAGTVIQGIHGIRKWNVDMQDCDNVLRIESTGLTAKQVEHVLQNAGYFCEELQD